MPTYQVQEGKYFVLIPLSHLRNPTKAKPNGGDKQKKDGLPDKIDHTDKQSPVRHQGDRGTCVAHAALAELEAILIGQGTAANDADLCENLAYYWFMSEEGSTPCHDDGLDTYRAAEYLQSHLVCKEEHWKYVATDPLQLQLDGKCSEINTPPDGIGDKESWGVDTYLHLPEGTEVTADGSTDIRDTQKLEELLHAGHNIVFSTIVAWEHDDAGGLIDVTLNSSGQPIFGGGGHAMLIVGYDRSGAKPYFIAKSSWGTDYGKNGYMHFTYDYIRIYAKFGYVTTKIKKSP